MGAITKFLFSNIRYNYLLSRLYLIRYLPVNAKDSIQI